MNLIVCLTLLLPLCSDSREPIDDGLVCRIQRVEGGQGTVEVQILLAGDPDGTTELSVSPEWGGVSDGNTDLSDLTVRVAGENGSDLPVKQLEAHRWSVEHAPGAALDLRYRMVVNERQSSGDPSVHRGTIVTSTLFHGIGELFLVIPEHLDADKKVTQSVEWVGFDESDELAFSFGVDAGPHRFEASINEFRHSIFIGGVVKLMLREVWGSPLWIAVEDVSWGFDPEEFSELAASVVDAQRTFFDDFDRDFYLISMIPVGQAQPGSLSLGGTGLSQSFSLAVQPGFDLRRQAEAASGAYEQIIGLLAHELFHDWNGMILQRVQPEQLVYWFSEGFTEFFARRLQLRNGFIEPEDYVKSLNDSLRRFHTSPVRDASNTRILEEFWTNPSISDLPYRRGDLVAMMLDHAIRVHSDGERSLDDLMREMVARGSGGWKMSTEETLEIIEAETSAEFAEVIRGIVVDGDLPVLDPETFAPCLAIEMAELPGFDIGFDVEPSFAARVVEGVRPDGPAFAAGLRDGDVVRGGSYHMGDAGRPVDFQIEREGEMRTIRFMPVGEAVPIQQFRLDQAVAEGCGIL